ncbi:MAG: histidine phosphatase family protein [Polyangiales bacterium]
MTALEVCLVRHGQSVSNARGVWQGQGDSPLDEVGRIQVEALGRALRDRSYDLVLSSDLSRAADTAKAADAEFELDPAWREIDVGDWEGLTAEEVGVRFPEQIAALRAREAVAIGGGESWPQVFQRADDALGALRRRMPDGGRVIVFTHGGIIAALLAGLLGARNRFPWPLGRMRNTGRTTLRFRGERVELLGHNDDSHVPRELRQRYEPQAGQTLVRFTSAAGVSEPGDTATTDFNSEIKSARKAGAGGVVSVSATSRQIAALAQRAVGASAREFRFIEPDEGRSSELLISERHEMLLDYSLPIMQI